MKKTMMAIGSALLLTAGLGACGDDEADKGAATITITEAWARTSPMNAANGAAYMNIVSPVADKLVSASVDAAVAGKVELHETVEVAGEMPASTEMTASTEMPASTEMSGTGGEVAMEMRPVQSIELAAGVATKLMPGGYHVMLLDLVQPLVNGTSIEVTLTFEQAGTKVITVPIRDEAP